MNICEECGFYRESTDNKNWTEERYCDWLKCFVDGESCKRIKFIFDSVCENNGENGEERCEYMNLILERVKNLRGNG